MSRKNDFSKDSGIAFLELSLSILLLLSLIGGVWALHSLGDMKKNIAGAIYRAFNTSTIQPFTTDALGNLVKWDAGNVAVNVITPIKDNIKQSLQAGSSLFQLSSWASLPPLTYPCELSIAYLDIDTTHSGENERGKVVNIGAITIVPPLSSGTPLATAMLSTANAYAADMLGKKINSEETRVLMDPDTLPQFALLGSQPPVPQSYYFQWAPFFVWGCDGDVGMIFNMIPFKNFSWTGVFVPKR